MDLLIPGFGCCLCISILENTSHKFLIVAFEFRITVHLLYTPIQENAMLLFLFFTTVDYPYPSLDFQLSCQLPSVVLFSLHFVVSVCLLLWPSTVPSSFMLRWQTILMYFMCIFYFVSTFVTHCNLWGISKQRWNFTTTLVTCFLLTLVSL